LGIETPERLRDWIDIGVYARNDNGEDELIYLNKHKITEQITKLQIVVNRLANKAVIDPRHILIDKKGEDNVSQIESYKE
jgi:tetrahydromethanopterin S-methyltransferase subunit B